MQMAWVAIEPPIKAQLTVVAYWVIEVPWCASLREQKPVLVAMKRKMRSEVKRVCEAAEKEHQQDLHSSVICPCVSQGALAFCNREGRAEVA